MEHGLSDMGTFLWFMSGQKVSEITENMQTLVTRICVIPGKHINI